jgi:hypothetical protein
LKLLLPKPISLLKKTNNRHKSPAGDRDLTKNSQRTFGKLTKKESWSFPRRRSFIYVRFAKKELTKRIPGIEKFVIPHDLSSKLIIIIIIMWVTQTSSSFEVALALLSVIFEGLTFMYIWKHDRTKETDETRDRNKWLLL